MVEEQNNLRETVLHFAEALDAAAFELKRQLAGQDYQSVTGKKPYDVSKIKWTQAEGTNGPYERSEDKDNPDFKALMGELVKHQGKFTLEGYFYWAFQNQDIIGRKQKGVARSVDRRGS